MLTSETVELEELLQNCFSLLTDPENKNKTLDISNCTII